MIKILDIWVKSQTFSRTSLERVQVIIDETGIEAKAASGMPENNVKPEPVSTTPTGSPIQVNQSVKSETANMVVNTTNTGEYQSWFCFGYVSCADIRLRNMGRCLSRGDGQLDFLSPTAKSGAAFRLASIWLGSSLSTKRSLCRVVADSRRTATNCPDPEDRDPLYWGKGIVYSVATMLQIYIPKAVAIFLQPARIFVSSWQIASNRRSSIADSPVLHKHSNVRVISASVNNVNRNGISKGRSPGSRKAEVQVPRMVPKEGRGHL